MVDSIPLESAYLGHLLLVNLSFSVIDASV